MNIALDCEERSFIFVEVVAIFLIQTFIKCFIYHEETLPFNQKDSFLLIFSNLKRSNFIFKDISNDFVVNYKYDALTMNILFMLEELFQGSRNDFFLRIIKSATKFFHCVFFFLSFFYSCLTIYLQNCIPQILKALKLFTVFPLSISYLNSRWRHIQKWNVWYDKILRYDDISICSPSSFISTPRYYWIVIFYCFIKVLVFKVNPECISISLERCCFTLTISLIFDSYCKMLKRSAFCEL